MPPSSAERWTLPRHLTVADVDRWLASEATWRDPSLHLGQHGCTADPGAAARLQAALCLLRRADRRPRLSVPPLTLAGDRAESAFRASYEDAAVTEAEKTLASSIEGLVLGQLCEIEGAQDLSTARLRKLQQNELGSRSSFYGRGKSQGLAVLTEGDTRDLDDKVDLYLRVQRFDGALAGLLQALEKRLDPFRRPWFPHLSNFGFEATENTFDHARTDFNRRVIPSARLLAMVRHKPGEIRQRLDPNSDKLQAAVASYLDRLELQYGRLGHDFSRCQLIEVTVADGGVGVAASMAGTTDVYTEQNTVWEEKALAAAYVPRGTGKPSGLVGMGHGLKKMLRACYRVSGLYTMTTGRFELARTFLRADGRPEEHDFEDLKDSAFDIHSHIWRRSLLAGTTCTVLFPLDDALVLTDARDQKGQRRAYHRR